MCSVSCVYPQEARLIQLTHLKSMMCKITTRLWFKYTFVWFKNIFPCFVLFPLLSLQQHPFFTLHDSKETDVASFVKVILDDWWAPSGLRAPPSTVRVGGDLSAKRTNGLPIFFLFFFLTHWNDRLSCTHTHQGGVTQGLTAALEWESGL